MNKYHFCKFKIPEVGGRVIWEVTNECNYGCKYCIFSSTGRKPVGELPTEKMFGTIDELKQSGFSYIKFTGGEPFLRPDMVEILSYAKKAGFELDISTNASKITPAIAEQLGNLKLNYVHVSIDGYDQNSHEKVRGKKSFEPTITGLKLLKEFNNKVRIGTVLHLYNQDHITDMVKFFEAYQVDEIVFSLMEPVGRLKNKNDLLINKPISFILEQINQCNSTIKISHNLSSVSPINFIQKNDKDDQTTPCPGGEKFLFINSVGTASPCTWVSEHKKNYHQLSLHEASLSSILKSTLFDQFNIIKNKIALTQSVCPMENLELFNFIEYTSNSHFGENNPIYSFSTENLIYLESLLVKSKKVLTITGSGDQSIVLSLLGAKEITNIDINKHAQFYAELKIIALQRLNYEEFKKFFLKNKNSFNFSVYQKLENSLSIESRTFWHALYNQFNQDGEQLRKSAYFHSQYDDHVEKIRNSFYLRNETLYNQASISIKSTQINYVSKSIINYKDPLDEYFDLILLSNLADYSHKIFLETNSPYNHIEKFRDLVVAPLINCLKPNGLIMFAYIFDALNIKNSDKRNALNNKEIRQAFYKKLGQYEEVYFSSSIIDAIEDCICTIKR